MVQDSTSTVRSQREVLGQLRRDDALTIREIRAATGLTHAAVTAGVAALYQRGIIHHGGARLANGLGRPAATWALRPDAAYVVGVDVGAQAVRVTLLDMAAQPLYTQRMVTAALLQEA